MKVTSIFHPFQALRNLAAFLLLSVSCLTIQQSVAQSTPDTYKNSVYKHAEYVRVPNQNDTTLIVKLPTQFNPTGGRQIAVKKAMLAIKLNTSNQNLYGQLDFKAKVAVAVRKRFCTSPVSCSLSTVLDSVTLTITAGKPEAILLLELPAAGFNPNLKEISINLYPLVVSSSGSHQATIVSDIRKHLKLGTSYEIEYGVSVASLDVKPSVPQGIIPAGSSKALLFNWYENLADTLAPGYELQLLKLYNAQVRPGIIDSLSAAERGLYANGKMIFTEVDWAKAATFSLEDNRRTALLVIGEGSGFYAWRIRPVGSYASGGAANAANFGPWSHGQVNGIKKVCLEPNSAIITKDTNQIRLAIFHYSDPDSAVNSIYSRTFSEGNRVSESVSYATELLKLKQVQRYLPSKGQTIVTQSVYDFTGRAALTTIPSPLETTGSGTGFSGYKEQFLRPESTSGRPYRADDFDASGKYRNPVKLHAASAPAKYYSGQGNVPSAQGYPYTRTLYYRDGTNRVLEQSGVGKKHMISDDSTMGRTVRTFYSTASEVELVKLFGDEAPNPASILKTTTVDQNGIATVSYSNTEGKTIATSVAINEQGADTPLLSIADSSTSISNTDDLADNQVTSNGIVSSKRLSFSQRTPVHFTYDFACEALKTLCASATLDCKYDLRVMLTRVDGGVLSATGRDMVQFDTLALWSPVTNGNDTIGFVYSDDVQCTGTNTTTFNLGEISLPSGSYAIEKQLYPKGGKAIISVAKAEIRKQYRPLENLLTGWMNEIRCQGDLDEFYLKLRSLDSALTLCSGDTACLNLLSFKHREALWGTPLRKRSKAIFFQPTHIVDILPDSGAPTTIVIKTGCCDNITIPIETAFSFPKDAAIKSGALQVNPYLFNANYSKTIRETDFTPDFEGYLYASFWDCVPAKSSDRGTDHLEFPPYTKKVESGLDADSARIRLDSLRIKFIYHKVLKDQDRMMGWHTPGTFNLMVYHMLTDQYSCDGESSINPDTAKVVDDSPKAELDPCTGDSTWRCGKYHQDSLRTCAQYGMDELFNCWKVQVGYVKDKLGFCTAASGADESTGSPNIATLFDEEQNNNRSILDEFVDNNVWKFLMDLWNDIIGNDDKDPNEMLRDFSFEGANAQGTPYFKYHLVNEFLNCTGYRFAKVLTDLDPDPVQDGVTLPVPSSNALSNLYTGHNRAYKLFPTFDTLFPAAAPGKKKLFTGIFDPVYAFKYFQYQEGSMPELEFNTCFADPNKCFYYDSIADSTYVVPCCPSEPDSLCTFCDYGKIKCSVTKEQWTCSQRFAFYKQMLNYEPDEIEQPPVVQRRNDYVSYGYTNLRADTLEYKWWESGLIKIEQDYNNWSDGYLSNVTFPFPSTTPIFPRPPVLHNTGDTVLTKIELDIRQLNNELKSFCESNTTKLEYRNLLVGKLSEKCYEVGDSKACASENSVSDKDIDLLVEVLVRQCQERGMITTFKVTDDSCRRISTPRSQIGYDLNPRNSRIDYGVGNQTDTSCHKVVAMYPRYVTSGTTPYYQVNLAVKPDTAQIYDSLTTTFLGKSYFIKECTGSSMSTASFCEWLKNKEVMETALAIDFPSKCANKSTATICDSVTTADASCPQRVVVKDNAIPVRSKKKKASTAPILHVEVKFKKDDTVWINNDSTNIAVPVVPVLP